MKKWQQKMRTLLISTEILPLVFMKVSLNLDTVIIPQVLRERINLMMKMQTWMIWMKGQCLEVTYLMHLMKMEMSLPRLGVIRILWREIMMTKMTTMMKMKMTRKMMRMAITMRTMKMIKMMIIMMITMSTMLI
ncbi:hypothetical protein BY996DRAFT_8399309 [Phakopsora pachyrhizi]|nr:hypothetical protein BY996DRAFT_8399309 [Phakopsora pachyrhizi]